MPFFVEIRLSPAYKSVPEETRNQHIAFLDANIEAVLAGGGLLDDDGIVVRGGFYILDVEEREQAENIVAQDPYITSEVFEIVQVTRWRKAYFNYKRLI
jgi:uncharacterized protein YciI